MKRLVVMAGRLFITVALFLCCSAPSKMTQEKHTFYAGSIKEGQKILKMYNWRLTKIDTLRDDSGTVYLFHYKELKE